VYRRALYECDYENRRGHSASILGGALLYRLTSIAHCSPSDVLSGRGPEKCRGFGRFNGPMQRTSYCTNNILVCIAEVLFHMYRSALDRLKDKMPYVEVASCLTQKRCLTVFSVDEIRDLVYVDCDSMRVDYDPRISGTLIVFPDAVYQPFREFSDKLRIEQKRGVFYPSARHSEDLCIALFEDETARIRPGFFEMLPVDLRLVPESYEPGGDPGECNPMEEKLNATMGYYRFSDQDAFDRVKSAGALNPSDCRVRAWLTL
jgi:RES domain-containing protein